MCLPTLAKDVDIVVDTIFNKYEIFFYDQDAKRSILSFDFIRDINKTNYFKSTRDQIRSFQMKLNDDYFVLDDYLDSFLQLLEVYYDKRLDNGCVVSFRVVDAQKKL